MRGTWSRGGEDDLLVVWQPFSSISSTEAGIVFAGGSIGTSGGLAGSTCALFPRPVLLGRGHSNFLSGLHLRPCTFVRSHISGEMEWDGVYRAVSVGEDKLAVFWQWGRENVEQGVEMRSPGVQGSSQTASGLPAGAMSARRRSVEEITIAKDRPASAAATLHSASSSASGLTDISSLLIPWPSSSSLLHPSTIYPMAKNFSSERALCDLASGFGESERRKEGRKLRVGSSTAGGDATLSASSDSTSSRNNEPSVLSAENDLLLTVCHGYHIKVWKHVPRVEESSKTHPTGAAASGAVGANRSSQVSAAAIATPAKLERSDTLTSRVMRFNTPVISNTGGVGGAKKPGRRG
jgi:hypothetical protein